MSEVGFFVARTSAFWPKICDILRAAKNVFMTSSVVLDKTIEESAENIVLVAALS